MKKKTAMVIWATLALLAVLATSSVAMAAGHASTSAKISPVGWAWGGPMVD